MGFVRTESWSVAEGPGASLVLPRWISHKWTSRSAALILSLVIDAGVVTLLLTMGDIAPHALGRKAESIATIDLSSANSQATSSAASASAASSASTPPTKIDASTFTPVPKEWSVTTLPPIIPPQTDPTPPAPTPAAQAAQIGVGSAGSASGAGYNPYAHASYRAPPPSVLTIVPPDALARFEAFLRPRITTNGMQIAAHVEIDNSGRISRFTPDAGLTPALVSIISNAALGYALCPPDPNRPPSATIAVTLHV